MRARGRSDSSGSYRTVARYVPVDALGEASLEDTADSVDPGREMGEACRIFISYRRKDSDIWADRLGDALRELAELGARGRLHFSGRSRR